MSYKLSIGNQDTAASAVYINDLSAVSASVISGSNFKGAWTGEVIANNYLTSIAASKLIGQVPDANISAASITQHQGSVTAVGTLTGLNVASSGYMNFGATDGASGYGFRDNGGTLQFKNSSGNWGNVGSGGAADLTGDNTLGSTAANLHELTGTLAVSGSALTTPALYVSSSNFRVGVGTNSPSHDLDINGELRVRGGLVLGRRAKTTSYTIATDDYIIGADTSGGSALTLTLPDASTLSSGRVYIIKDEGGTAGTHNITIAAATDQTVDGVASVALESNYAAINVYCNGVSKWFVY